VKRWLSFLAIVIAGAAVSFVRQGAPPLAGAAPWTAPAPRFTGVDPRLLMGAGSCAAAACHHGNFANDHTGSEYSLWISKDRHARAYEILFDTRSLVIQQYLHASAKAHEDQRCLACHVAPNVDLPKPPPHASYFKTDGVSCESCHGPAKNWINVHHLDAWKVKTPEEKQRLGMADTQSTLGRVKVCVTCHVGAPGMDVDHDLIAAGHPRLNFEFTAMHADMPHHWSDAKDRDPGASARGRRDFEARAWVMGQLVTAHAALELLADRAGNKAKLWPEFAEHDCYACHHDLQAKSWRQQKAPARGGKILPWSDWYLSMAPRALEMIKASAQPLDRLKEAMKPGFTNRAKIAESAKQAARDLGALIEQLDRKLTDPIAAEAAMKEILVKDTTRPGPSWDEATQVALGLSAMYHAQLDMKTKSAVDVGPALQNLFHILEFPKNYDSPKSFDPEAVRARLLEFKNMVIRRGL
jgi:hypothetical protein